MRKLTALTVALSLCAAGQAFTDQVFAGPRHAPAAHAPTAHAPAKPAVRSEVIHGLTNNVETERRIDRQIHRQQEVTKSDAKAEAVTNLKSDAKELSKEVGRLIDDTKFNGKLLGLGDVANRKADAPATGGPALLGVSQHLIANANVDTQGTAHAQEGMNLLNVADGAVAQEAKAEAAAARDQPNVAGEAEVATDGTYIAGLAIAVGSVMKFKQHKENPTQIPIGTPVALVFVEAALLFLPSILSMEERTVSATAEATDVPGVMISAL